MGLGILKKPGIFATLSKNHPERRQLRNKKEEEEAGQAELETGPRSLLPTWTLLSAALGASKKILGLLCLVKNAPASFGRLPTRCQRQQTTKAY